MARRTRRVAALITAVLVAAVLFFLLTTLPEAPRMAAWAGDPSVPGRTAAGAYHLHTTESDGASDRRSVAAAAARAGLQFVIFTDHGDGTRQPHPPEYLSGVLCVDGTEISTNGGHYVALGMREAPYPLGGEAAAVVEDVARLGGFGIAAHPDSPNPDLAWTDWSAPIDGVEWLNADSEWRDEPRARMARVLFDYFLRPGPALASMFDRPVTTLTRWDALTVRRPVVALAAHDAHGGIGRGEERAGWRGLPVPSYEASFRSFSTRVLLDAPLSGDAARDGERLIEALRAGRTFTAIDALARDGLLNVVHDSASSRLHIEASMPEGAEVVLLHASGAQFGTELKRGASGLMTVENLNPRGAYRVEVRVPFAPGTPPVPWLLGNPVRLGPVPAAAVPPAAVVEREVTPSWRTEHDPLTAASAGATADGRLEFTLGPAAASSFAALVGDIRDLLTQGTALMFQAAASRPMRISVQLRFASEAGKRWGRSVYVDSTSKLVTLWIDELLPLDGQASRIPNPATAESVLFVVDLTNAVPGASGHFTVSRLSVGRLP